MSAITLTRLTKRYGRTTAVEAVDLAIDAGELFFLLGPSGCGKTTLLRMIAGFIEPNDGRVLFGDRDVTDVPANKRNVGMVFQSYALWPHMTVLDNVSFGLSVRKVPRAERRTRALAALEIVQMGDYAARKPNQLSGGQQQRVALARALVIRPTILLLDEPLSNLDAKLRLEMRSQIRQICRENHLTGVYVTHDQKEALSMADRVAVLREGRIVQVGRPRELYERPRSRFVADFLGETNFLSATVASVNGSTVVLQTAIGRLESSCPPAGADLKPGTAVTCSIRPEAVRISDEPDGGTNTFSGRIVQTTYLGEVSQYRLDVGHGIELKAMLLHAATGRESDNGSGIAINPSDVVVIAE